MTPRIQRAIDIFLDAINEGTLAKGTCVACAVGNLVANGINGTIYKNGRYFVCNKENTFWSLIFSTTNRKQKLHLHINDIEAIQNCKVTDFTVQELAKIEFAFETNTYISYLDYTDCSKEEVRADQIKGLEAVVKVMLEFDEQEDNVKEVFTSKAKLIPI